MYWFTSVVLYTGFLMLGYVCIYNLVPLLCMFLNEDVDYKVAMMYPELYKNLLKGRHLSTRTFFLWNAVALAASILIIFPSLYFVKNNFQ